MDKGETNDDLVALLMTATNVFTSKGFIWILRAEWSVALLTLPNTSQMTQKGP